jgi:hypothetical protein
MFQKLSYHWGLVQGTLFPSLKAKPELSEMTRMHQRLIALVEVVRVEKFIKSFEGCVGRPERDRCPIARAFIAKTLYNVGETKLFIEFLTNDSILRRICGWENKRNIPSESTFSRAFAEFAKSELATRLHEAFVVEHHGDRLVGEISRDATAIEAREKATPKLQEDQVKKEKKKRGRPKKGTPKVEKPKTRLENQVGMNLSQMLADLPRVCDIGTKKNSKGFKTSWKGYKLHVDTANGDIPISALLTSASTHDSQVALPLAHITESRVTYLYELMDAAYDAEVIRDFVASRNHVALIDFNHRGPKDERCFLSHEAHHYKVRISAERVNSQLKDNYGGNKVRVRGPEKVMSHLMFGILALTVEQTLRFLT